MDSTGAVAAVIGGLALGFGAAYLALAVLVRRGMRFAEPLHLADAELPTASVVIAARNEAPNIRATLESLRAQRYPARRWDVVVVDDRSTDATGAIVDEMARQWPALRRVRVDACPPDLGGKQNALDAGFAATSGEFIIMTDADGIVPPTWLGDIVQMFRPGVGLVAGFAAMRAGGGFVDRVLRADLAHLIGSAWGFIGMGRPFSAIGNNLAIRRATYRQIGGYRSLGFTIVEDIALVQRVCRTTRWKTAMAPVSATTLTSPPETLRAFLRQRTRWASAVRSLAGWPFAFATFVFLHRAVMLLVALGAAFGAVAWPPVAASAAAWMLGDALILGRMSTAFGEPSLVRYSPLVTIWQAAYHTIVGLRIASSRGRVGWHGTAYRIGRAKRWKASA